jgi:Protein of unknown function (DUF3800)
VPNVASYGHLTVSIARLGVVLKVCYIDESGGFEAEGSTHDATPLMVLLGLIVDHEQLRTLTRRFLEHRQRFYRSSLPPGRPILDVLLEELKGSTIRRNLRSAKRNNRRQAIRFLDGILDLLIASDARLIGRVWIKGQGEALDPVSTYTFAVQDIARHFEHYLASTESLGIVICDARQHAQDILVGHSIVTQKNQHSGDALPHIVDATVFGRSQNYAGMQIADLIASAVLFPTAAHTYCTGYGQSVHNSEHYDAMRIALRSKIKRLRYGYQDAAGKWRGGFTVSDRLAQRPSSLLFQ